MAIKSFIRSICACLTFVSFNAHAYILSIADNFDQYTKATWEIVSAVDDGNGGVNVAYDRRSTWWDT